MANIGLLSEITAFSMHIFAYCSEVSVHFTLLTLLTTKMLQELALLQHMCMVYCFFTFISCLPIILLLRHW